MSEAPKVSLSSLCAAAGYELVIHPEPYTARSVLGNPAPDSECAVADGYVLFARADTIDYVYSASHEIAEHTHGFGHTDLMWMTQANLLAAWCKMISAGSTWRLTWLGPPVEYRPPLGRLVLEDDTPETPEQCNRPVVGGTFARIVDTWTDSYPLARPPLRVMSDEERERIARQPRPNCS